MTPIPYSDIFGGERSPPSPPNLAPHIAANLAFVPPPPSSSMAEEEECNFINDIHNHQ